MNVLTVAHVEISEGSREAFIQHFDDYRTRVLSEEPGTLTFDLCVNCHGKNQFLIEERFLDEASRQAHLSTDYHDAAVNKLRAYIVNGDATNYQALG